MPAYSPDMARSCDRRSALVDIRWLSPSFRDLQIDNLLIAARLDLVDDLHLKAALIEARFHLVHADDTLEPGGQGLEHCGL